ncbi:hypothetical protein Tco_1065690, partial [Tanacetum coccineum]
MDKVVRWCDTKKPDIDTEKRASWGHKTAKVYKSRVLITLILDVWNGEDFSYIKCVCVAFVVATDGREEDFFPRNGKW